MGYKPSISDEAVEKATGHGWEHWFKTLDKHGAKELSHKEIVRLLSGKKLLRKDWWCQSVTVEYEKSRGLRTLGQTADAGFEIGVQKMIPVPGDELWKLLTSPTGAKLWLGELPKLELKKDATFQTKDGTTGEIRSVDPPNRLRLTYRPKGRSSATTLQLYFYCNRNTPDKTNLRFHHEKLADGREREVMKEHWQTVLGRIAATVKD